MCRRLIESESSTTPLRQRSHVDNTLAVDAASPAIAASISKSEAIGSDPGKFLELDPKYPWYGTSVIEKYLAVVQHQPDLAIAIQGKKNRFRNVMHDCALFVPFPMLIFLTPCGRRSMSCRTYFPSQFRISSLAR